MGRDETEKKIEFIIIFSIVSNWIYFFFPGFVVLNSWSYYYSCKRDHSKGGGTIFTLEFRREPRSRQKITLKNLMLNVVLELLMTWNIRTKIGYNYWFNGGLQVFPSNLLARMDISPNSNNPSIHPFKSTLSNMLSSRITAPLE